MVRLEWRFKFVQNDENVPSLKLSQSANLMQQSKSGTWKLIA